MEESVQTFWRGLIGLFWLFLFVVGVAPLVTAEQLDQARVSQVIQDVKLLETRGAPHPAAVNDKVTHGMGVRTGVESRAELTFSDLTITRLGANTIFSFKEGAREVDLTSGAVLLQVPPAKPSVKVSTSAVTAAVTGGTALFSTGPPMKFMVLEGVGTIYPLGHPERAVTVDGGQMMTMTPDGRMTKPQKFDVKLVVATSRLIQDFPPLENLPLIMAVVNQQLAAQLLAGVITQPLARNLIDVIGTTDQNANANPVILVSNSSPN
ncbi:MAG: FecR domain-containing protein, partial [Verrucomicrobia bacterium]|nr:FecR domain-containing protein [Verrucomicrobiota bacterium]